jgi:hypothetical protein
MKQLYPSEEVSLELDQLMDVELYYKMACVEPHPYSYLCKLIKEKEHNNHKHFILVLLRYL